MNETNTAGQTAPNNLTWLLDGFKGRVPGVDTVKGQVAGIDTVLVVSTDGLPTETCTGLVAAEAETLAAITAGAYSLMSRISAQHQGSGRVRQIVAQLDTRMFFVTEAAPGSLLAVVAHPDSDAGAIGHEMLLLANQVRTHFENKPRAAGTPG